jgi:hypothetical protein
VSQRNEISPVINVFDTDVESVRAEYDTYGEGKGVVYLRVGFQTPLVFHCDTTEDARYLCYRLNGTHVDPLEGLMSSDDMLKGKSK